MTLQQLEYFVAACRYGNISRAAVDFDVSQPSISVAIKNLENEFGVQLIRRRQTGFTMTSDGDALLKMAQSLLSPAKGVSSTMQARGHSRNLVRLGMPPMAGAILFPTIYSGFCVRSPQTQIVTKEAGRDELLRLFENNELDMALLPHTEPFGEEYESIPVMRYETVCCVPKAHPLAMATGVTPVDLKGEPLVLFASGFFQTTRVLTRFEEEGIQPQIMHTSTQLSTVEELIAGGVGLGFLFKEICAKHQNLAPVPLSPRMYTQISLVIRRDSYVTDGMKAFADYIRAAFPHAESNLLFD